MCGFAGFITRATLGRECLENRVEVMNKAITARGPDDAGVWVDPDAGIALGHRRLSIIDLSPLGRQPMVSRSGRYVIVFNGEIYNYQDLAGILEKQGYSWRGHSDTEVLLAAFEFWGVKETLEQCNGMFALALWDQKERSIFLARDRMGQKPLYYGFNNGILFFGSQIKAFRAHPEFKPEIDHAVMPLFLKYSYIPTPYSIYKNIKKLSAAHFIEISRSDMAGLCLRNETPYWNLAQIAKDGINHPMTGSEEEMINSLEKVLQKSVSFRMLSDVPLGAFLSGGIDSSLIVALMQKNNRIPVKTFSIGFNEKGYDEAGQAKRVAHHLGTDHTELYASPKEAMDLIPDLPVLFDEPFADSSQIPVSIISMLTKKYVTVALSGDGGDELFAGYNRHFWGRSVWETMERYPCFMKKGAKYLMEALRPEQWERLFDAGSRFVPEKFKQSNPGAKIAKLSSLITARTREEFYTLLTAWWSDPEKVILNKTKGPQYPQLGPRSKDLANISDFTQLMQYWDMRNYLCDDIMTKVDRASMGSSLEARSPFLDPEVVAFSWKIPIQYKISKTQGKLILKNCLYRFLPPSLVNQPKKGFQIPLDQWLRGPLRPWAEEMLNPVRLKNEGFFNVKQVRSLWNLHLSGKQNYQYQIWNILMFQAWVSVYGK
ncbi:MAG: asparagine synthase (glutamine-hydrolyzing) [Deltaproteobacteria bacterium]|nr:MAG: asparagine synthase (glutamine-hydrolyzing) [Deltaproteobacteria bacterium]